MAQAVAVSWLKIEVLLEKEPAVVRNAMLNRNDGGLCSIRDIQFGKDYADMIAHCALRQVQPLGNIGIVQSTSDQTQDIDFTLSKFLHNIKMR
jgi:hypothetical protein